MHIRVRVCTRVCVCRLHVCVHVLCLVRVSGVCGWPVSVGARCASRRGIAVPGADVRVYGRCRARGSAWVPPLRDPDHPPSRTHRRPPSRSPPAGAGAAPPGAAGAGLRRRGRGHGAAGGSGQPLLSSRFPARRRRDAWARGGGAAGSARPGFPPRPRPHRGRSAGLAGRGRGDTGRDPPAALRGAGSGGAGSRPWESCDRFAGIFRAPSAAEPNRAGISSPPPPGSLLCLSLQGLPARHPRAGWDPPLPGPGSLLPLPRHRPPQTPFLPARPAWACGIFPLPAARAQESLAVGIKTLPQVNFGSRGVCCRPRRPAVFRALSSGSLSSGRARRGRSLCKEPALSTALCFSSSELAKKIHTDRSVNPKDFGAACLHSHPHIPVLITASPFSPSSLYPHPCILILILISASHIPILIPESPPSSLHPHPHPHGAESSVSWLQVLVAHHDAHVTDDLTNILTHQHPNTMHW